MKWLPPGGRFSLCLRIFQPVHCTAATLFPPLLLSMIGLTMALIWALPYNLVKHTYPISTFYSEALTFSLFALLGVLSMIAVWQRDARVLRMPRVTWMPLAFVAVVLIQRATMPTELPQLMMTALLYGVAMIVAVNAGYWLAQLGWRGVLMRWSAVALTLGGLYAVGAQLVQAFHLEAHVPWLVAKYTVSVARRLFGNMYQPNHLATYLSLASAGAFYLWYQRKLPAWAFLIACAAFDIGICLTGSRTPWLQLALLSAFGLWLVWMERSEETRNMRRSMRWFVPAAILPMLALMTVCVGWANIAWGWHLEGSAVARMQHAGQVTGRVILWEYGLTIFREHWFFGAGWSNYIDAQFALVDKLGPVEMADNAHNVLIDLLAKIGIVGALAVLLPLAFWFARAVRNIKTAPIALAFVLLGMLAIHSLLEYPQHYAFFLLPAMFLLGFCETKPIESVSSAATGAINGVIVLFACVAIPWLYGDYQRVEVAYRAGKIEAYRTDPALFFAPYGDYAVTGALYLSKDQLDEKLAAHREALALGAGPTMIKRYVVLLALAGRDDEALQDVQRLKNYNTLIWEGQYAALVRMLREQGDDLKPFVKRVIDTYGRPTGETDTDAMAAPRGNVRRLS
ncbi:MULTISPECIES: O-antigen ligase family protein [Pandoraea]|uniref:PglL family O-oligosaccharyltransferase n=1 Tax=Pandoraea TaxID=93217 RepID=UPI001F5C2149|nr:MULTISPECIES: O-antigen ligase family protein [Pandoraea]MCI3203710.1 polymerase [Pandoraea sp. LA3]MDN4581736.1 polymerase [Pandoraea capi]